MKLKNIIPIITSILLALVLVVIGCNQVAKATPTPTVATTPTPTKPAATPTTTTTPTPTTTIVEVDKKYNVLDPTGIFNPIQTKALAPRLDTIDGKTIYVVQGEADPVIMPALIDRLQKDYPKTTWVFYQPSSSFGITAPDDTMKKDAKAAIRGNGW